jgi:hypothetical protein
MYEQVFRFLGVCMRVYFVCECVFVCIYVLKLIKMNETIRSFIIYAHPQILLGISDQGG